MDLNFKGLEGLTEGHTSAQNAEDIQNSTEAVQAPRTATQGHTDGPEQAPRLLNAYNQEKTDHERAAAVYREYQKNIKAAGELRAEITKGTKAGEPLEDLFLKAVKCIALMTGNNVFYNQIETDLKQAAGREGDL